MLAVFPDLYGRLMGKRFDAEHFLARIAESGTHACNYLLTVDMEMEPVAGYEFTNWQKGYGDFHLVPDFRTLRQASWLDRTAVVLCDLQSEHDHALIEPAPRTMLLKQIEAASKLGYDAMAASELEYYFFRNSYRNAAAAEYRNLEPAGWYLEDYHALQGTREEDYNGLLRRHLKQSGIAVESTKGEWGKGQHEVNVEYTDVLSMADNHTILKQCAKEVADQLGVSVTFMAKLSDKQAGSSCHVHLSLWKDGRNAFAGRQRLGAGEAGGGIEGSGIFLKFLAGWLAHAPEVMVFYAPNVNSYKRYQSGSSVPTIWPGAATTARPASALSARRESADRVPHPRRRLQSVPRLRGRPGVGARRHRQRPQAAGRISRRRLSRVRTAARPQNAGGGNRPI